MNDENYIPTFTPDRTKVKLEVGALIKWNSEVYQITQLIDYQSIMGVSTLTGMHKLLRIEELSSAQNEPTGFRPNSVDLDLSELSEKDWETAEDRYNAIKPLLAKPIAGRQEVEFRADQLGVNAATLYRWLKRYKSYGVLGALVPQKRGWKTGKKRVLPEVENQIQEVLNDFYLTSQRPSGSKVVMEVKRRCYERGLESPSHCTIRARMSEISEKKRLRKHGFSEKAANKFLPTPGHFPNATYPLSVVQIDHTPADLIVVDDEFREPIGRPWITMAIDVNTRVVVGYYLSLDAPSETSVAMCVAHSILPKEEWLALHNIDADWPVWGVPQVIHVDNGPDFRSNNFRKSCLMHSIELQYRPVKVPRYGGHIERLLGTFLAEIHAIPGSTFSGLSESEGYNSEKNAVFTMSEFEEWFVEQICNMYHSKKHASLEMSPKKMWDLGIFGTADKPGVGLPPRPQNRLQIMLDFLPSFPRTIQTTGITIEGIRYYSEALRPWIGAIDPETGKKLKLVFRRDPRTLKIVWMYDPKLEQYFEIPFADQSKPDLSTWELKRVKEQLKLEGTSNVDEHQIFETLTKQRERIEQAKEKSKKARRQAQRQKIHKNAVTPSEPLKERKKYEKNDSLSSNEDVLGLEVGDISGFGDIA